MLKTLFLAVSIPSIFSVPFVAYHYAPPAEPPAKPFAIPPISQQAPMAQPQLAPPQVGLFTLYIGLSGADQPKWVYWVSPSLDIAPFQFCFTPNGLMNVNNIPIYTFIAANPDPAAIADQYGYIWHFKDNSAGAGLGH